MKKLNVPKAKLPGFNSPEAALRSVTSKSGLGVFASADKLYKDAVFGRDSLEVAEDLLAIKPKLVKNILLTMGRLQGYQNNPANEEEPGKIVHEYRATVIDGVEIDDVSKQIFNKLSQSWGGSQTELAYYGSVDSTPLFIKTLSQYCLTYGKDILLERFESRSGNNVSILEVLEDACHWLVGSLNKTKSGMLEFQRENPRGIENQVWKDSVEAYVHNSGELANHNRPIASIEVQALAYDAMVLATKILPSLKLEKRAAALRDITIAKLWDAEHQYFYLGQDYRANGKPRPITTTMANAAEMLNSSFFDNLTDTEKQKYIGGIVKTIMGQDFLTDAGIRSRSLADAKLINHWDYHGSFVTWPKETYDIAKGLRRQGFPQLATQLENRLLNLVKAASGFPEFVYVDEHGRIYGVSQSSSSHGEVILVHSTNSPEKVQAWTVSAIIAIQKAQKNLQTAKTGIWQNKLERDVLKSIPHVRRLRTKKEVSARYPFYPYELSEGVR